MLREIENCRNVVVYTINLEKGGFLYLSEAVDALLGYSADRFYREGLALLFKLMHEEDYRRVIREYSIKLKDIRSQDSDKHPLNILHHFFRLRHPERTWLWVENTCVVLDYTEQRGPHHGIGFLKALKGRPAKMNPQQVKKAVNLLMKQAPPLGLARLPGGHAGIRAMPGEEAYPAGILEMALQPTEAMDVSEREKDVLQAIADGWSAKEIARQLYISESTVVSHRKNLLRKFKAKNTAELIKKASKVFWLE